jgi:hypothetical protein
MRKFARAEVGPDTYDQMCAFMERWLRRRYVEALVSWRQVGQHVTFGIKDLSPPDEVDDGEVR